MTARGLVAALLAALACPVAAQDQASEAESWNLYAEVPARFEATVTDPLCALTGDCPAECGGGTRQLVLLRSADDVMILPVKNHQPLFTGAATELQPFCGKMVEVDGLMLVDADTGLDNIYQVQKIREVGTSDWTAARSWTEAWARANPDLPPSSDPWFRRDPRVTADITQNGWFGLGPERDAAILSELFP